MAVDGDHERKTNRGFGGSDGDGKNRDHDSGRLRWRRTKSPERDEVDVRGGEHHFDANQNEDPVTAAERGKQSDGKERTGNDEKHRQRHSDLSSMTKMSAPISAAVSSTPTQSKGH